MNVRTIAWLVVGCLFTTTVVAVHERLMVIVTPSYNNKDHYKRNLDSLFSQKYDNYRLIYLDDVSTDGTYDDVKAYLAEKKMAHRVTLIKNSTRQGGLKNIYDAVHMSPDNAIIITLDGDDWFMHDQVLARINQTYADPQVWMTYGQFVFHPAPAPGFCAAYSNDIIQRNAYRQVQFIASHPRTFYAWLFKKIRHEDLLYQGDFFMVTWDQVMMYPMLEMSGTHARFIPEVLYVYNQGNPISDGRMRLNKVLECERYIKRMKPYARLAAAPISTT